MATPVLMSLTSALLGPGTSEIVGACAKVLAERVKTAHDNYQQTTAQAIDMVENERHQAISKINELRNRAAVDVDQRPGGLGIFKELLKPCCRFAYRADEP